MPGRKSPKEFSFVFQEKPTFDAPLEPNKRRKDFILNELNNNKRNEVL